ncbi:MAG: (2Fe-2S)-binding protein [Clostridia bacterium]|nr:(2Fe-2S)-binding protein [Clostridia bacterium]
MANKTINIILNGESREYTIDVRLSLTDLLRGEAHLHSVKKGCEVGECGCCTVLINGEPINSCIYLAIWADGKQIRTLESLTKPDGSLSDIQQAFIDEGAVQCGFCTPGFIMSSIPLIESDRKLTREEIRRGVAGNLCRCTGYENIINAIEKTAEARRKRKENN